MSMNQEDITKYKSLYLQTSWGYLNMLNKNVAFLIKGTEDDKPLDSCHLAAHSLKSQSLLMDYNQIGKLSEQMERIFKLAKENDLILDKFTLELINKALKKMHLSLTEISNGKKELDLTEEIKELEVL